MMMIAFYRAKHGGWLDKIINWMSGRGGYSHCELVFSDRMFFTSSGRDGGVRFKMIDIDPEHWEFWDLKEITPEQETRIKGWCRSQTGKKYDWLGVLGFVIPMHADRKRWFCSEICIAALCEGRILQYVPPQVVTPNTLRLIIIARAIGIEV